MPDQLFLLGERFVYALISATGMFFIGSCFSIYHGISLILQPGELEDLWLAMTMLSTINGPRQSMLSLILTLFR